MDQINKAKSISIWIFIVPFIAVNTCLILITQFQGLFPNQEDIIHNTIPYFDGGASISRTARPYPSWLIFKPAMFLTSYFLIKYWIYNKQIIEFFDELRDCKILICPDHLRKAKPDPEGINLACDKLDIDPNFACYVGDHDVDIAAGLAANVPVFACEYGYGSFEKGSQSNEIRIMHPSEIIQFIEKINE